MGDSNSGFIGWVGLAISWAILVADDWMEKASYSLNGDSLWRNIWWPKAYRNLCHTRGSNVRDPRVHIPSSLDELSVVCSGSVYLVWSVLYNLSRSHIECLSDGICCICSVTSVVANCWRCRCFVGFMWLLASLTLSTCPFIVLGDALDSLAICISSCAAWSLDWAFLISGSLEEYFVVF